MLDNKMLMEQFLKRYEDMPLDKRCEAVLQKIKDSIAGEDSQDCFKLVDKFYVVYKEFRKAKSRTHAKYSKGRHKAVKFYRIVYGCHDPAMYGTRGETSEEEFNKELAHNAKWARWYRGVKPGGDMLYERTAETCNEKAAQRKRNFGKFYKTRYGRSYFNRESDWNDRKYQRLSRAVADIESEEMCMFVKPDRPRQYMGRHRR